MTRPTDIFHGDKISADKLSAGTTQLYDAFAAIRDKREFYAFMKDLCTVAELRYLQERWRIAQLLHQGRMTQQEIAKKNQFGLATITRVSKCLRDENSSGYKTILNRIGNCVKKDSHKN
jgi:TrpR-related protein YerC/YecD